MDIYTIYISSVGKLGTYLAKPIDAAPKLRLEKEGRHFVLLVFPEGRQKQSMGSAQSSSSASERAVIARLRALQVEEKNKQKSAVNEDGFVEVESQAESGRFDEKTLEALRRFPTTLDVAQLEGWQTRLLEDPKNRYVYTLYTPPLVHHPVDS